MAAESRPPGARAGRRGGRVSRYAFDNAAPHAVDRFRVLQHCFDPVTRAALARTGVVAGWRCLEVGAGAGSAALWLSEVVGPTGQVVATDIDPGRIDPALRGRDNLTVLRHDIVRDAMPGTRFDLIHARLVLLHLPQRGDVLTRLVGALEPGGWLVLEEFDCTWTPVLATSRPGQRELFEEMHARLLDLLADAGADVAWGGRLFAALRSAGLEQVTATIHAQAWPGGGVGIGLHRANTEQLHDDLLRTGLSRQELSDFRALLEDPGFAVQSYPMVTACGRRGADGVRSASSC